MTQIPQAIEAERAVLGGLLLDFDQVPQIAEVLRPEDFYAATHADLYRVILEHAERGAVLDVIGLADLIMASGNGETFGGLVYATSLPELVPTTENLDHYAQIVREKAVRRRLLLVSEQIRDRVNSAGDLPSLLDFAEGQVQGVAQDQIKRDWEHIAGVIDEEWAAMEGRHDRAASGETVLGTPTGYTDLDGMLSGLQPTDLIILAARPAMGKTALALNIAQTVATRSGVGVGVFSMEMSRGQLVVRMMCAEARVDMSKVRSGIMSRDEDWPRMEGASEVLYRAPIWIDDTPGLSIVQLRSRARRLAHEHPELGLIVVDYLQLMTGTNESAGNREQAIAQISRGLKGLAKELNVPVLALSQLNRGVEARANKRPLISDLRESGAIEQDADIIMFIYRDEYYNPGTTTDPGVAELIVAKHRNGPTGTVRLAFIGRYTRFENLAPSDAFAAYA